MEYQHTQYGYLAAPVVPFYIGIIAVLIADEASPSMAVAMAAVIMALTLGLVLMFSRLNVRVASDQVHVAFGAGWPRRTVDLNDVVAVNQVRNHWYLGFGIRRIPRGWMYNVWGLDAVEIELPDGKVLRIGTNDPDGLHSAIALRRKS